MEADVSQAIDEARARFSGPLFSDLTPIRAHRTGTDMFPKVIEVQVRAELDEVFGNEPVIKHVQGFTVRFDETLDDDDTDDLIDHVDRLPGGVLIADQDGYGIGVLCDATGTSMVPSVARHLTGWFEAHNLAITELHARLILRRDIV